MVVLTVQSDEQWILGFLRGCKFSLQTTKEKFDMYYTVKNIAPELAKPKNVYSVEIQAILRAGIILPLPYYKNYQGPRVILFRFKNCDTSIMNVESTTALFFMFLKMLMFEDDNFVVSGVLVWLDMAHYPLSFLFQVTLSYIKHCFLFMQKALPIRIKGIHVTGSLSASESLFNLMKVYMPPKLKSRLAIYSENKFENIFDSVPKKCMPKEYGGENSNVDEIRDYWIKKTESYSTWFEESNQYYTNEEKRPEKPALLEEEGSFRKLNID